MASCSSLIEQVIPMEYQSACIRNINTLKNKSVMSIIKAIGGSLCIQIREKNDKSLTVNLNNHISDSVRCWGAYIIGSDIQLSIEQKL